MNTKTTEELLTEQNELLRRQNEILDKVMAGANFDARRADHEDRARRWDARHPVSGRLGFVKNPYR